MKRILGIDPGTRCGYALLDGGRYVISGWWDLRPRRYEGGGMRYLRFRRLISEASAEVDLVAYEEVRRHLGVDAAHIYGGLIAQLAAHCEEAGKPYLGIPVGTAKKAATGKGNADKGAMVEAAREFTGRADLDDDNEADAIFVALAAHEQLDGGRDARAKPVRETRRRRRRIEEIPW